MVLTQPVLETGRSPSWQGKQVAGLALPGGWNLPCDHDVHCVAVAEEFTWQEAQSPRAGPAV